MRLTYDYLCDLLRQLDEATDMLNAGDPEGIRQLAHRVKGTSGTFGLVSIAEEFARLEEVAEDDGRERTLEVVMRIREMAAARRDASAPGPPS